MATGGPGEANAIEDLMAEMDEPPRKTTKELQKEEKERLARLEEEARLLALRTERMGLEVKYVKSCRDQVNRIFDKLGLEQRRGLVEGSCKQVKGMYDLSLELAEKRIRLIEDAIKGRNLRSDLMKALHLEVISDVLNLQERNIDQMTQEFFQVKDKMLKEKSAFIKTAQAKGMKLRDEIRLAMYAAEKNDALDGLMRKGEQDVRDYNEMCSRRFEEFYNDYQKTILDKWVQFKEVFESYKKKSDELRRDIYIAEDQLEKDSKELTQLDKEKKTLEEKIEECKREIDPGLKVEVERMKKELKFTEEKFESMKKIERTIMESDQKAIDHLNRVTDDVIDELKRRKKIAEKVVRLKKACEPYETEDELALNKTEDSDLKSEECEFQSVGPVEERTARVQLHNAFLQGELKTMDEENKQLKCRLKEVIKSLGSIQEKSQLTSQIVSVVQNE